jgi:hypothetical protein
VRSALCSISALQDEQWLLPAVYLPLKRPAWTAVHGRQQPSRHRQRLVVPVPNHDLQIRQWLIRIQETRHVETPVGSAEGPAQESGAASWGIRSLRKPTGSNAARSRLLPVQRIILRAYVFHPRQDVLDALAHPSSSGRRRTEAKTTCTQQVADQFLWLRNWHIAAYPLTIYFTVKPKATPCDPGN